MKVIKILSEKLYQKINYYFDLSKKNFYQLYCNSNDKEKINEVNKIQYKLDLAYSELAKCDEINGYISIDSKSFKYLFKMLEVLKSIDSYYLSKMKINSSLYYIFSFVSWGESLICDYVTITSHYLIDFTEDELMYYICQREQVKLNHILPDNPTFLWFYIYDILLNTCYNDVTTSLSALKYVYNNYDNITSGYRQYNSRLFSKKTLGFYITNYMIYNWQVDKITDIANSYGFDDDYAYYDKISKGDFKNTASFLLDKTSSKLNIKSILNSDLADIYKQVLENVLENIFTECHGKSINMIYDLCGIKHEHTLWNPYGDSMLLGYAAIYSVNTDIHRSFCVNNNVYFFSRDEDRTSDANLGDIDWSTWNLDNDELFNCKYRYYRNKYTQDNNKGILLVDYIIRKMTIIYREVYGGRKLKEFDCPYMSCKRKIDEIIKKQVLKMFSLCDKIKYVESKMFSFFIIPDNKISVPSSFKYPNYFISANTKKGKEINMQKKKIKELINQFNVLKDEIKEDEWQIIDTLSNKLIPSMLSLDIKEGMEMMKYILKLCYNRNLVDEYNDIVENLLGKVDCEIMLYAIKNDTMLRDYIFSMNKGNSHICMQCFFSNIFSLGNYSEFNNLLEIYSKNNKGKNSGNKNLGDVLYYILTCDEHEWNPQKLDIMVSWIKKVKSKIRRTKLEVLKNSCEEQISDAEDEESFRSNLKMDEKMDIFYENVIDSSIYDQSTIPQINNQKSCDLDDSLKELSSLIGLENVKSEVYSLMNLGKMIKMRLEYGMKVPDITYHLIFSGNPGTGKTSVARILGKIYFSLGLLPTEKFIEVNRSDLIAGYVGQTALKTQSVIDKALGGVLFIDEAYSLTNKLDNNDFGAEAIEILLKSMEEHRNELIVIVAGYSNLMENFLNSNPGLKSRFKKTLFFDDYNGIELYRIFEKFLSDNEYMLNESATKSAMIYFNDIYVNRDDTFGNARFVRNVFEAVISCQANRIADSASIKCEDIGMINLTDFEMAIKSFK